MSQPKKILVAEDSSIIINLTKSVFSLENYEIYSERNGKKVLERLEKEDFDLILMDITMPIMNGMECTHAIRKLPNKAKSSIPIIAISGNIYNMSTDEFKNEGFNDFVKKPIDYDNLVSVVKNMLSE